MVILNRRVSDICPCSLHLFQICWFSDLSTLWCCFNLLPTSLSASRWNTLKKVFANHSDLVMCPWNPGFRFLMLMKGHYRVRWLDRSFERPLRCWQVQCRRFSRYFGEAIISMAWILLRNLERNQNNIDWKYNLSGESQNCCRYQSVTTLQKKRLTCLEIFVNMYELICVYLGRVLRMCV